MAAKTKGNRKNQAVFATPEKSRNEDILWRSVRHQTDEIETAAFNFHDFTNLPDVVSDVGSISETEAPALFQKKAIRSETYRLAEWKLGEAAKLRKKLEKAPAKKPDLQPGTLVDLDRSTAEKFRRGKLPIESRLDLHGLNQDTAIRKLKSFIDLSYMRGNRCALVVTGKGDPRKGGGILKKQVPYWLNLPENRTRILAIANAQPKDGGGGALYILLKRRR